MIKSAFRINRSRAQRIWVGLHDLTNPTKEKWIEVGHLYEGFAIRCSNIIDVRPNLQEFPEGLGYKVEGDAEPAQNEADGYTNDLADYQTNLNGVRNLAILVGNVTGASTGTSGKLWLWRIQPITASTYSDNRIALTTDFGYAQRDKAYTKITGFVRSFERYAVSNVQINSGRMSFTKVGPNILGLPQSNTINQ